MRQQFLDATGRLSWQSGQHIFEVGVWLVPVELGGLCRPPNYAEWARFSLDSP